ncbi:MAG: alpha/beta hydrolase [Actinomycetota bacterium]
MTGPISAWPGELVKLQARSLWVRSAPPTANPAEPALFVHGLGGSGTNWTDLMDLLRRPGGGEPAAPALDGMAVDLPGFGFSPAPADGDYSVSAKAQAVVELIEHSRRWPVHLVGNSLGGAVCTRVAAQRPDLVRTLTLISPALPDLRPRLIPLRVSVLCVPKVGPWLLRRADLRPAELRTDGVVREVYQDPALMHPARRDEEIAEVLRRDELGYAVDVLIGSARGLVAEYARFGPRSLWRDAARVTAPVLVLYGSHDRLVSPARATQAARAFPGARVLVLPRTGHVAMMERPAWVAREMRTLLSCAAGAHKGHPDPERGGGRHPVTQAEASGAG